MLTVGELFAGIGGFGLGLERAGMRVVWQSEIDPYASAVLRKHWPHIPNHGDIRSIQRGQVERPDVLAGGPPCQRTSVAAAIQGKRTNETMWPEMHRVVAALAPEWAIVEQPPGNRAWEASVAEDLAGDGYQSSRFELTSASRGAPHLRRRVFIVAHAMRERCEAVARLAGSPAADGVARPSPPRGTWASPGTGNRRMDVRFPDWVDRLRCLGNSLDPRVAEVIGRAIVSVHD